MQSINQNYKTYKPDVLVRGKYTSTYRLTGSEYRWDIDKNPLTVVFRPSGYQKELQLAVTYGQLNLNSDVGQGIEVKAQFVNELTRKVTQERLLYKGFAKYDIMHCPMCSERILWNDVTSRWKCSGTTCGFDYSQQSCAELDRIYTGAMRGINNPHLFGVLAKSNDNLQTLQL